MMKLPNSLTPLVLFLSVQGCSSVQTVGPSDFCAKYDINVFEQGEKISTCRLVLEEQGDTMWELRLVSHAHRESELNALLLALLHEDSRIVSILFKGSTVDVTIDAGDWNFNIQRARPNKMRLSGRIDGHAFVGSVFHETEAGPERVGLFVAACDHRL